MLKIDFPYHLKTLSFCLTKSFPRHLPIEIGDPSTLVQPQVLLRNWDEEILDSFHVLMLKLSFSRDMAKYLGFTLCRGGALSPQDLVSQDKIFQKPSLRPTWTRSNLSFPYNQLSIWLSYCNLYDPGRAHNAMWLH